MFLWLHAGLGGSGIPQYFFILPWAVFVDRRFHFLCFVQVDCRAYWEAATGDQEFIALSMSDTRVMIMLVPGIFRCLPPQKENDQTSSQLGNAGSLKPLLFIQLNTSSL